MNQLTCPDNMIDHDSLRWYFAIGHSPAFSTIDKMTIPKRSRHLKRCEGFLNNVPIFSDRYLLRYSTLRQIHCFPRMLVPSNLQFRVLQQLRWWDEMRESKIKNRKNQKIKTGDKNRYTRTWILWTTRFALCHACEDVSRTWLMSQNSITTTI